MNTTDRIGKIKKWAEDRQVILDKLSALDLAERLADPDEYKTPTTATDVPQWKETFHIVEIVTPDLEALKSIRRYFNNSGDPLWYIAATVLDRVIQQTEPKP